jgi:putative membrane protein insertion efficiency factor
MKGIILKLIKLYQRYFSWDAGWAKRLFITDRVCRFEPSCSGYSYQAVEKHGLFKGGWLSLKRVLRCHPWSKGGQDPVP